MKVLPLDDRVLVEPIEESEQVGSIIIPETAKEKPSMGTVVAIGTSEEVKELIKVGDKVIFTKYAGEEIKVAGKKQLLLQVADLLAKVQ